jgi:hypothetical protein
VLNILSRLHNWVYGSFLRYFRTREVLQVFKVAHAQELCEAPVQSWPLIKQRHSQEVQAIKAGKLQIVDRKSWAFPYLPSTLQRLSVPLMKSAPYSLRRMARTPVPRRAINMIKGAVISQPWDITPKEDVHDVDEEEQKERIKIAKKIFNNPNNIDSFQTWIEMGMEDMLIFGAFVSEIGVTLNPDRPIKLWSVTSDSIRVFPAWTESTPDMPHYAQMTGLKGERGAILFYEDEFIYCKDNISNDNPFGLGKMEIGFQSIADFLGVQGMAGRAGVDTVHKSWLWWEQPQSDAAYNIIRRHIQNELEGQAKISIIGGMKKPEVLEITPVLEQDLLLGWQEMLIRMIANAFDLSAMSLGIEHDVNRAVGTVLDDKDFRTAVVPMAKRLQEVFTRKILHHKLGWHDLEFKFLNLEDPDQQTMIEMLSRMYSANALTPNQMRRKMSMELMDSPFADLTQFECMLLNIQAQSEVTDKLADNASSRQLDTMKKAQAMQPKPGEPGGPPLDPLQGQPPGMLPGQQPGQPGQKPPFGQQPGGKPPFGKGPQQGPTQQGAPQGGKPKAATAPKPLKLPKFPIAGSAYTAEDIAGMSVQGIADAMYNGKLPSSPKKLLKNMQDQEPNILQKMTDEIKEFFEQAIEKEQSTPKKKLPPKFIKKMEDEAGIRFRKDKRRTNSFADWLWEKGQGMGKPGSSTSLPGLNKSVRRGGRPGDINPQNRF